MSKKKGVGWQDPKAGGFNNPLSGLVGRAAAPSPPPKAQLPAKAAPVAAPPTPNRAVVRVERKGRGGKTATLVTHLGLAPQTLASWCSDLRRQLGCGGSVEGEVIVLQGEQRDRVAQALTAMGVKRVTLG